MSPMGITAKRGTALYHATTDVPIATSSQTVKQVLALLRSKKWKSSHHVFIVENLKDKKLLGVVSARVVLESPNDRKMSEVVVYDYPAVPGDSPEDQVAILAIQKDMDSIPVVDDNRSFLGTVDAEDLLKILHERHTDHLLERAGILRDEKVVNIFKARVLTLVRLRIPWLLIGLAGGMLATKIVSRFSLLLEEEIALAFFIPVIAYMNDAAGTQTVTLFVRGLSLERANIRRQALRELGVGTLMGAVFGVLIFLFALLAFNSLVVAQAVGISMFLGISVATVNALTFPYLFYRMGRDPALGSDALVTIVQDILSIMIYLAVSSFLVLK